MPVSVLSEIGSGFMATDTAGITASTPVAEIVICHRAVIDSVAGPVAVGAIKLRDDPHVLAAPDAFQPLLGGLAD